MRNSNSVLSYRSNHRSFSTFISISSRTFSNSNDFRNHVSTRTRGTSTIRRNCFFKTDEIRCEGLCHDGHSELLYAVANEPRGKIFLHRIRDFRKKNTHERALCGIPNVRKDSKTRLCEEVCRTSRSGWTRL